MSNQKQVLDRRVRKTKLTFKNALLTLMKDRDFRSITITDIVNLADCNRGTFYTHYGQKEDLINEITDEMIAGLVEAFRKPYKNKKVIDLNTLSPSTIALFDYILANAEFYKLIFDSNVLPDFQIKMINTIIRIMKEDMNFLIENRNLEIDNSLFITYRAYGIFGLVLEWVKSDFEHSPPFMAKQLINIFNFHTPKVLI